MSSAIEKALSILELMVQHPSGLAISDIARETAQAPSSAYRVLQQLSQSGYVRQVQAQGEYVLTMKLPAMGITHFGRAGINDVAQPVLDRLAQETRELVRLSIIDGDDLIWIAVAQGATSGLRYEANQEQGVIAHLARTSAGQAWLATMTDDEAIVRISRQGLGRKAAEGGDIDQIQPISFNDVLAQLKDTRKRGYSLAIDSYIAGMAAMAVVVRDNGWGRVLGCLSIAGPSVRCSPERMAAMAPLLLAAAEEIGHAARGSQYFQQQSRAEKT